MTTTLTRLMPILPTNTVAPIGPTAAGAALVCFRQSPIHGIGGFAKTDLPAGTRVIEYIGEKITKAESLCRCELNNEYIFALDDDWDLDGNMLWNPARFLNHSCAPNCEAELDAGRVWIRTLRHIGAGEELTLNYGYDLEDWREHPCYCGAPNCAGYIVAEEFFAHVRKQRALRQSQWQSARSSAPA
jgi:SET domain-containing protein